MKPMSKLVDVIYLALATVLCVFLLFWIAEMANAESGVFTWEPYKTYTPPTRKQVFVKVTFADELEVRRVCGGAVGCYKETKDRKGNDLVQPEIITPFVQDFNDVRGMAILGHEMLHALGANHD